MSPRTLVGCQKRSGFPRVSGDEPEDEASPDVMQAFSPRERG